MLFRSNFLYKQKAYDIGKYYDDNTKKIFEEYSSERVSELRWALKSIEIYIKEKYRHAVNSRILRPNLK